LQRDAQTLTEQTALSTRNTGSTTVIYALFQILTTSNLDLSRSTQPEIYTNGFETSRGGSDT